MDPIRGAKEIDKLTKELEKTAVDNDQNTVDKRIAMLSARAIKTLQDTIMNAGSGTKELKDAADRFNAAVMTKTDEPFGIPQEFIPKIAKL